MARVIAYTRAMECEHGETVWITTFDIKNLFYYEVTLDWSKAAEDQPLITVKMPDEMFDELNFMLETVSRSERLACQTLRSVIHPVGSLMSCALNRAPTGQGDDYIVRGYVKRNGRYRRGEPYWCDSSYKVPCTHQGK